MEYVRWRPEGAPESSHGTWHVKVVAGEGEFTLCALRIQLRHDIIQTVPIPVEHLCRNCVDKMAEITDRYLNGQLVSMDAAK